MDASHNQRLVWEKPTWQEMHRFRGDSTARLIGIIRSKHHPRAYPVAVAWLEGYDLLNPPVRIGIPGRRSHGFIGFATTGNTQDWPIVEAVIPREDWPHEIHSTAKDGDPALRALVDAAIAELREDIDERPRDNDGQLLPLYRTRDEAVQKEIIDPINTSDDVNDAAAEFDIDAIVEKVIDFHDATFPGSDKEFLSAEGFYNCVAEEEFWTIVDEHPRLTDNPR